MASPSFLPIFMLHDADRNTVDDKHHVGTIAFARRRLDGKFPGDVKCVGCRTFEIDHFQGPLSPLIIIVPAALTTQPRQRLPITFNRGTQRFNRVNYSAECRPRLARIDPRSFARRSSRKIIPSSPPRLKRASSGVSAINRSPPHAEPLGTEPCRPHSRSNPSYGLSRPWTPPFRSLQRRKLSDKWSNHRMPSNHSHAATTAN